LFTLKLLLRTLVVPPAGPLLLAVTGAVILGTRAGARARRAGWVLLAAGLAALWLLATPCVSDLLARAAQREPPLDLARPVAAQAIVILGGGLERIAAPEYGGADAAGPWLLERLAYGAYLARRTGLPVLVSGTATEARAMRASLARDFALEPRWVENQSRDTFENAQFSARLLRAAGVSGIVLVTDADHAWRAAHEFAGAGFTVVPAPVGDWGSGQTGPDRFLPGSVALARSASALHELCGDLAREVLASLGLRRQAS
jgi:uncharacterized SAM-binding protein YcdF (DUF218 family)